MNINKGAPRLCASYKVKSGSYPMRNTRRHGRSAIVKWLIEDTWNERFIDAILVSLCEKLRSAGISIGRSTVHFRVQHPQWLGARLLWTPGLEGALINRFDYGIDTAPEYLKSPTREIVEGHNEVREKLSRSKAHTFVIFDVLASEGFTEYVAWPLRHTLGKRHMISFATKREGGFAHADYAFLKKLVPILAMLTEVRTKNILARTLLQTYVGSRAADEILSGSFTRGNGETIKAAIMICDMRDFTAMSNHWPRDDVIAVLNSFFDALCAPVDLYGGEILKFMGDGMLAIFPLSSSGACHRLLRAVNEALDRIGETNRMQKGRGLPDVKLGIGVHVGDVMYGNIGSQTRLDFTVIGPAVNLAARLESLTKTEGTPVLISADFIAEYGDVGLHRFKSLGHRLIRGVDESLEIFAISGLTDVPI